MAEYDKREAREYARVENARVGYQVAVDLHTNEVDSLWSKFNSLLVANSVILASIGLSMTASNMTANLIVLSNLMPIVGIVLCWLWFSVIMRGFAYQKYWILSARQLEELYLSRQVRTLSRGGRFAGGEEVRLPIGSKIEPVQIGRLGRFKTERGSYIVICLFLLIYLVALTSNIISAVTGSYGIRTQSASILEAQIQWKDKQIDILEKRILDKDKVIEETHRQSEAVILKLTQQLEKHQELLESQQSSE